jgi:hypothetical protein
MMSFDAVELLKECPEDVFGVSLAFHGDFVYIGCCNHVLQWNIVTDSIVRLDGFYGKVSKLVGSIRG